MLAVGQAPSRHARSVGLSRVWRSCLALAVVLHVAACGNPGRERGGREPFEVLTDTVAFELGAEVFHELAYRGGTGAQFVSEVKSGSLPPGLSLDYFPCLHLVGTPQTSGTFEATVQYWDVGGVPPYESVTQRLTVRVVRSSSDRPQVK